MQQANNLVLFPNISNRNVPQSLDQIIETVSNNRIIFAEAVVDDIFSDIIMHIKRYGYDILKERDEKDLTLAYEALKSVILKSVNVTHPLQEFAEKSITIEEESDDNN